MREVAGALHTCLLHRIAHDFGVVRVTNFVLSLSLKSQLQLLELVSVDPLLFASGGLECVFGDWAGTGLWGHVVVRHIASG